MTTDTLKLFGWFVLLLLLQVGVLGHIHLFGYATPLLYVYFIARFPRGYAKWGLLLWGFTMGLLVDVSNNTPGVATTALTTVAAIQPYYLELFVPRDSVHDLRPSMETFGPLKYAYYIIPLVLFYCLLFYTLEILSLADWLHWLLCVAGSTVITLVFIYTFEIARRQ